MTRTKLFKQQIRSISGLQIEQKTIDNSHLKDNPDLNLNALLKPMDDTRSLFVMYNRSTNEVEWSEAIFSPDATSVGGILPSEIVQWNHTTTEGEANKVPVLDNDGKLNAISKNSDKLTNPRTISITGKISGSTIFDGSQNVELPITIQEHSITPDLLPTIPENKLLGRTTGSGNYELIECTPFARTLLDDIAVAHARATLELGTSALRDAGTPNGVAELDSDGYLKSSQIPPIAISDTFVVASESEMLLLTAQRGDVAIRTDISKTLILRGNSSDVLSDWEILPTPTDIVSTFNGRLGDVVPQTGDYSYSMITGLGNSATRNVGGTTGTVCAGDDSRLTNARVPLPHDHTELNVKSENTSVIANGYNDVTGNLYLNYTGGNSTNWIKNLILWDGRGSSGTILEKLTVQRLVGSADIATKLETPRNINGVSFDGTHNIYIRNLQGSDTRILAPSHGTTNTIMPFFTAWNNNNNGPWADSILLRTYGDASGGNDNLISFNKSGIGMRIWQQGFGSSTAFSTYKDVCFTDDPRLSDARTANKIRTSAPSSPTNGDVWLG